MTKVLVLSSTFPKNLVDDVPLFVYDQLSSISDHYKNVEFTVLVPEYFDNRKVDNSLKVKQIRYNYFWPYKFQKLVGRGILPTINKNKLYIIQIPFFIIFQILNTIIYSFKYKPDIIYAHWVFPQALTALIVNKIFKIPYVFTTHAYDAEILRRLPFVGPFLARKIIQNSNSYTSDSKKAEKKLHSYLKNVDQNMKKSIVLPMPIKFRHNLPISSKISKSLNELRSDEKILLFVGRFAEKKGVENLLEIFINVKKAIPNAKLFIAGSGPLLKVYEQFIGKNNLDKHVFIFDYVNSTEKSKLYEISNVSVIPSIIARSGDEEGLPVVVIESLSRNIVTFASYQSNAHEIIKNEENGFLFDPQNIEQSSKELIKVLDRDKADYQDLINQANKSAEPFKAENSAHIFYQHLFNI